jgi:DNA-directed RNA polymerase alpha subunit
MERKLNLSLAALELSVRATSCLECAGITTVRALVSRTEEELLMSGPFGETTLREVKAKLAELGISLGMKLPEPPPAADPPTIVFVECRDEEELLERKLSIPLDELSFSVRSGLWLQERKGLRTVGDLVRLTEEELMAGRAFGVSILEEVRSKLAELDLHLGMKPPASRAAGGQSEDS